MANYNDHPWDEIIADAKRHIALGRVLFQKYSCANCGAHLTMEEPNRFWYEGTCDQPQCAGIITDIHARGCNYMLIQTSNPIELLAALGLGTELPDGLVIVKPPQH